MAANQAVSLYDTFERALDVIRARVSVSAAPAIAVAYSGGLDSSALLYLAHQYATARGVDLCAFHVHHGISANADTWQAHCERECTRLGIRFEARRVTLSDTDRHGIEQAARLSRYAALGEMCRSHGVPLLLTAHHLDDQAETVLLQLLRGCGVAGMSGMESAGVAPDLLADAHLLLGRPLLDVTRSELERFVSELGLVYVEDESNADHRYARNALRHKVMPMLAEYFPGFQERFARAARHAQSAQRLLDELAAQDLAASLDGEGIDIGRLRALSQERADNLLRYWFASRGMRMPATSWLGELCAQLFGAREDAQLCVSHPDCDVRRHRGRIFLTPKPIDTPLSTAFRWRGEALLDFRGHRGRLHFEPCDDGFPGAWLSTQELVLGYRGGGEKLKASRNRPTRSLKHHYQELGIPAWERLQLPLVYTASGRLLYAAGIGMNWRDLPNGDGKRICLRWETVDS